MNRGNVINLDKLLEMWEKEERRNIQSSSLDGSHTTNNYRVVDKNKLFEEKVFGSRDLWDIQVEMLC